MFYISQQNRNHWKSELDQIPFDYFLNKQFYLKCLPEYFSMSILSILPKLLKQRIPDCKVFIINNTEEFEKYDAVFGDNPYIDDIVFDPSHDFYFLNMTPKEPYPNLTYEDCLIKDMLHFWKFEGNIHPGDLIPEIYFNENDINYIQELNRSWCENGKYVVINGIFEYADKLNEIIDYYQCSDNIISFYKNSLMLNDCENFNVPDKIKLGLIKFATLNIGYENDLFNLMRKENSIYITDSKNNLKNIHYIKSK